MGKRLKEVFGRKVAFGLEGGYNLQVGRLGLSLSGSLLRLSETLDVVTAALLYTAVPDYVLVRVHPRSNFPRSVVL